MAAAGMVVARPNGYRDLGSIFHNAVSDMRTSRHQNRGAAAFKAGLIIHRIHCLSRIDSIENREPSMDEGRDHLWLHISPWSNLGVTS